MFRFRSLSTPYASETLGSTVIVTTCVRSVCVIQVGHLDSIVTVVERGIIYLWTVVLIKVVVIIVPAVVKMLLLAWLWGLLALVWIHISFFADKIFIQNLNYNLNIFELNVI